MKSPTNTPEWFGYGEDTLTYWALENHLDAFLKQLNDNSLKHDTTVFYRPSFGRRSDFGEFGEFDAIIATPKSIYLIEAKWSKSSKAKKGKNNKKITLKEEQIERHEIFRWYFERYKKCRPHSWSWEQFVNNHVNDPTFPGKNKKLARPKTILAHNLKFVLDQLLCSSSATTTTDVLLYLYPQGCRPTLSVCPRSFRPVSIDFVPVSCESLFFEIK